jgi:branched-chain amino acid transport system ATP-binding protein
LLFIAALAVAPLFLPEFYVTLLNYIGLYAIVALGLVMLTGVGGLTSFGQAAFVGLGAYTSAYLTTVHGVSPWLTLPAGLLVTAVVALLARSGDAAPFRALPAAGHDRLGDQSVLSLR